LQNPRALNDLRALLQQLGLGDMNFPQLSEYFRQAGLTFGPTHPPSVPPDFVRNLLQVARHCTQRCRDWPASICRILLTDASLLRHARSLLTAYETYTFGDQLTPQQKENFVRDGFVHMRNIVKRPLIDAALRDINRSLGCGYTREQRLLFDRLTWCPELVAAPSILDLLYMSPALALAMSLIGPVARVQSGVIQARVWASIPRRIVSQGVVAHFQPRLLVDVVALTVSRFWVRRPDGRTRPRAGRADSVAAQPVRAMAALAAALDNRQPAQ